ncbi:MAG TPA: HNH endonuclease [Dehalococcoidia bacterium]|nr:HNH endonuclease [Dehalococcoidia bacterium]
MVYSSVLVLNQNYEPLNVCTARRAIGLVLRGRAEVIEIGKGALRSATRHFPLPSVIRLVNYIKRPSPRVRLSRKEIFARDGWTCMYCGRKTSELTVDHVIPRHKGGEHTWQNLVAACRGCNHRKAGQTPAEAKFELLKKPKEPRVSYYYLFRSYLDANDGWRKFVPGA